MDPWSLPGPSRFLTAVVDGLREGQNLVLGTTLQGPNDVARVLRERLLGDGWRVAGPLTPGNAEPVEALFQSLGLAEPSTTRRTMTLLSQRLPSGQVVCVDGVSKEMWSAWQKVLLEYEAASRSISVFDRSLLVVVTVGVPLSALQLRAAALRVLPWQGVVGELDMLLFASSQLHGRMPEDFRFKLVVKTIAKLALWDFALAEELIERPYTDLFRPLNLIAQVASDPSNSQSMELNWESGGLQRFDGVELLHPFIYAASGDPEADLAMRVWAAQASEIFPAIELHRRDLAKRIRTMIRLPVRVGGELVEDLDDLEIGQLAHLADELRLATSIRQLTEKWRRLRNKLAHLEVLESHEALDPGLLMR